METSPFQGCIFRQKLDAYDFAVRWDVHHAIRTAILMRQQQLTSLSLLLWEKLFLAERSYIVLTFATFHWQLKLFRKSNIILSVTLHVCSFNSGKQCVRFHNFRQKCCQMKHRAYSDHLYILHNILISIAYHNIENTVHQWCVTEATNVVLTSTVWLRVLEGRSTYLVRLGISFQNRCGFSFLSFPLQIYCYHIRQNVIVRFFNCWYMSPRKKGILSQRNKEYEWSWSILQLSVIGWNYVIEMIV